MKNFISAPNVVMEHISWVMFALVLIIGVRLLWELRGDKISHRAIYKCLVAGVFVSSLLFFYKIWAFWALLIVCGFMLGCSVVSRSRARWIQYVLSTVAIGLVGCGVVGVNAPIAPVIVAGPSMWPTSPKHISTAWLTTTPLSEDTLKYGDDVYFEAKNSKAWPNGRYRKRIWALPGDTIEIRSNKVFLNHKMIANCSNRSRRIAPNIWWCTITFPNGVQKEITWGLSNSLWVPELHTTLKSDHAFAVGDNTVESTDSRVLDAIETNWVEGRFQGKAHPTPWVTW